MRVALIFWGLTRSLKYTNKSIKQNILLQLKRRKIKYDIFMHTYYFSGSYNNARNREHNIKLDFNEYKRIKPKYFIRDNQDTIKDKIKLKEYRTRGDPWKNNYKSLDNLICSLYSKNRITQLFNTKKNKYQAVIFLRPDVLFIRPLNVNLLKLVKKYTFVPDFHSSGGYNDRMMICSPKNALYVGQLYTSLLDYSKNKLPHSEQYLKYMVDKKKIKIKKIKYPFKRVRANGKIDSRDIRLR